MLKFLELQCLVDDQVRFLKLSMFINASLQQILFDEVDRGNILLDTIHIIFKKKCMNDLTNDLQLHLQRINTVQKKMTGHCIKRVGFLLQAKKTFGPQEKP